MDGKNNNEETDEITKTINVPYLMWKELQQIRLDKGYSRIDQVIEELLKKPVKILEDHSIKIFKDIKEEFFDFGFPEKGLHNEFVNGMNKIKHKYVKKILKKNVKTKTKK